MDAEILTGGKDLLPVAAEGEFLPAVTTIEPPAIIQTAGPNAGNRFAENFTVHIQNPHTRRAYFRNALQFLAWCERQGYRNLRSIKPMTIAAYIEQLKDSHAKPSIKQQLATIRMLFVWLASARSSKPTPPTPSAAPSTSSPRGSRRSSTPRKPSGA